jgi:hypothetical protein
MQFTELHDLIRTARWFACVGTSGHGHTTLLLLVASNSWEWLPTTPDQSDPIHADTLNVAHDAEIVAIRMSLVSLRRVADSVSTLVDGPNDYSNAAKGGAKFATRMAAREISNAVPGFWCETIRLFHRGWWPCGLTAQKQLIVF